jgi:calcineurin-like phosphoesterase family protein
MIYFISDLHFYHFNIIKSCHRPFRDEIEMNTKLIENFNDTVSANDHVYILGDLSYRYPDVESVNQCIRQLNGIKHLILGNHDIDLTASPDFDRSQFRWIKNYYELSITAKRKIILFHYPIIDWNNRYRGDYHLYGHVHYQTPEYMPAGSFNVSAENIGYKPISLDDALVHLVK